MTAPSEKGAASPKPGSLDWINNTPAKDIGARDTFTRLMHGAAAVVFANPEDETEGVRLVDLAASQLTIWGGPTSTTTPIERMKKRFFPFMHKVASLARLTTDDPMFQALSARVLVEEMKVVAGRLTRTLPILHGRYDIETEEPQEPEVTGESDPASDAENASRTMQRRLTEFEKRLSPTDKQKVAQLAALFPMMGKRDAELKKLVDGWEGSTPRKAARRRAR